MSFYSEIIGVGSHFPERVMTNQDFESFLETSDEWIQTRTGIKTRRIADHKKGESTLSFALGAAQKAMARAGISGSELDIIIVGTVTPESVMPTTANSLQGLLGAEHAFSFDLQAACSGFLYGLSIADQYLRQGTSKTALVIGAETLSDLTNWQDRSTCVLFGDGAGAAVLRRTENPAHSIVGVRIYSDGRLRNILTIEHGYSHMPVFSADYHAIQHKIKMDGKEVFKHAVRNMVGASANLLEEHKLAASDVNFFIFHQANMRIIDMCTKTLGVPPEKTWVNLDKYGNTSAATLPSCLDEAWRAGRVKKGDLILMSTFGGGVTWGSALFRL